MNISRRELVARVEHWRERIAPEWQLSVITERPELDDPDVNACCTADDDYLHAAIWVNPAYLGRTTAARLDVTIVHELVHLYFRDLRAALEPLEELVGKPTAATIRGTAMNAEERAVDRLARLIVGHGGPGTAAVATEADVRKE